VGRFGPTWAEWNDHFRDTVRDFWRGVGGVQDLGYRLSGSSDLYGALRRPWASVNFVTAHDGFTLRDTVSYSHKHNLANGEDGRDGTDNNRSANYGTEGETADPAIRAMRTRQARNLAATLLLSTGTPLITQGDEMWRTQRGNNNAYCQDNDISWVSWEESEESRQMLAFFRRTLGIRSDAPALHQGEFFEGRAPSRADETPDLAWFDTDGQPMTISDWFDSYRSTLQMWINGNDVRGHGPDGRPQSDSSWLMVLHAGWDSADITLPGPPYGAAYTPVLDTDSPTGEPADPSPLPAGIEMTIKGRSLWLLRAHRSD
jgi:isoamylase